MKFAAELRGEFPTKWLGKIPWTKFNLAICFHGYCKCIENRWVPAHNLGLWVVID
jgi:hypothetical protein